MRIAGLALVVSLCLAGPAAAANEAVGAVQVCGRLVEHRAATAAAPGSVTIGTRTYAVAPGTVAGNGGVEIAAGRDLCFEGSRSRASGVLMRYLFFWYPRGPVCGTVAAARGGEADLRADFGLLTVLLQQQAPPRSGDRVCYETAVTAAGDLAAVRTEPADTTLELEWVWHCGTIRDYRPATAAADGAIGVGSEAFRIARGTAYTGDPAGDRTDRTAPGTDMCLRGVRGTHGALVEYATEPLHTRIAAQAREYAPPAGGAAGIATLAYRSQLRLRIPAAIDAAVDLVRGSHCLGVGVDARGDATATAVLPCEPGRAGGSAATASPGAAAAPAVAPTAVAAASSPAPTVPVPPPASPPPASPSAAAVSAAQPSPPAAVAERSAEPAPRGSGPPLPALALAVVLATLAALAYVAYVRRPRAA